MNNMDKVRQLRDEVRKLREKAERLGEALSSSGSPSSQNYLSPERFDYVMREAQKARDEANRIEATLDGKEGA